MPANYDQWKATNPADETLGRSSGRAPLYRCLTCPWMGHGILAASAHFWQQTDHNVKPATDPRFAERDRAQRKASA